MLVGAEEQRSGKEQRTHFFVREEIRPCEVSDKIKGVPVGYAFEISFIRSGDSFYCLGLRTI